ncbi:MAG: glycine betaine ABC transporter substrate-binding protein, partial [Arenicella sp.]
IKSILLLGLLAVSPWVSAQTIHVGGKNFTEQIILSELTAQYLEEKGFKVELERGLPPRGMREALLDGRVDVYWEYIGTAYLNDHKKLYKGESREEIHSNLKRIDAENGLVWLNVSLANDTYALAMNAQVAQDKGIQSMADLANYQNTHGGVSFATEPTFFSRKEDGLVPLERKFAFKFNREDVQRMEIGLIYGLLGDKTIDVGLVYSTDGRILSQNLLLLDGLEGYFPPYHLAPVINEKTLLKYPRLERYLNELSSVLTTESITQLNSRVDVDKVLIWEAVEEFLISKGMLEGL